VGLRGIGTNGINSGFRSLAYELVGHKRGNENRPYQSRYRELQYRNYYLLL
jgi:hypothetical protein